MTNSRPQDPQGVDEGISQLTLLERCTLGLLGIACNSRRVFVQSICRVMSILLDSIRSEAVFCSYAALKLLLELCVQTSYYMLQGLKEEEVLKRIAKRSKHASSFSMSMIKLLKGVHKSRKNWLTRVYLRISDYLHPSIRLHVGKTWVLDTKLFLESLDACLYLLLVAGVIKEYDEESAALCRFEKSLRLLRRRKKIE